MYNVYNMQCILYIISIIIICILHIISILCYTSEHWMILYDILLYYVILIIILLYYGGIKNDSPL